MDVDSQRSDTTCSSHDLASSSGSLSCAGRGEGFVRGASAASTDFSVEVAHMPSQESSNTESSTSTKSSVEAANVLPHETSVTESFKTRLHTLSNPVLHVSSLPAADKRVLRGTRAYSALSFFASVVRDRSHQFFFDSEAQGDGNYALSFATRSLDDFWSHSWHALMRHKVITMLLHYNGFPAVATSVVAAVTGVVLSCAGVLPKVCLHVPVLGDVNLSIWATLFGIIVFTVVLVFWRSSRKVFLDKVCIHQTDPELKKLGVEGIGVFLRYSRTMVVFWDPSYTTRLWCIYELAAFLSLMERSERRSGAGRDKRDRQRRLLIRPIFLGELAVVLLFAWTVCKMSALLFTWYTFGWCSHIVFGVVFHYIRESRRHEAEVGRSLQEFSVQNARCYCCSVGHTNPADPSVCLPCDRLVVEACIKEWFGTLDTFEGYVRQRIYPHLNSQLSTRLPFHLTSVASLPLIWLQLDEFARRFSRTEEWSECPVSSTLAIVVKGCTIGLTLVPLWLAFVVRFADLFRKKLRHAAVDFVASFLLGQVSVKLLDGALAEATPLVASIVRSVSVVALTLDTVTERFASCTTRFGPVMQFRSARYAVMMFGVIAMFAFLVAISYQAAAGPFSHGETTLESLPFALTWFTVDVILIVVTLSRRVKGCSTG
mmetsp:Transcript_36016/g.99281  ORF Transcript_36016/g.99281 Transcript_36016/m.99281 type:complete len:656 (+) Transcript_36016:94-2061(+)|eukprot:CAMPEP_0117507416 /NCGR_PEP_ID=MMETSP0784-20121206/26411_1 /TAXON_ID=39447 /ORGANISM="" /LENGTH=655 /DNA_ID=CAMNT_0005302917 /DNA_START=21 /DNA_END=1988 /DNA_ORIENTATION=+